MVLYPEVAVKLAPALPVLPVPLAGARVRPTVLARRPRHDQQQLVAAFTDAWETGVLSPDRLVAGCVYEGLPLTDTSYRLAVMRFDPRRSGRRCQVFHEWRPEFAPGVALLNGYRSRDAGGNRLVDWRAFVRRYLAELDTLPTAVVLAFLAQLSRMPSRYRTVTLLCAEHAPIGDERLVHCHRRLLRAWLLGQSIPEEWKSAQDCSVSL